MSFIHQLRQKPWVAEQVEIDDRHSGDTFALPTATVALRIILAVATVLFSLSVVAYGDRMLIAGWRPLPEPWLMWVNTAMLILGSVAMEWACVCARRGQLGGVTTGLLGGGVFAFFFLVGQLVVWQQLVDLGYFAATNPANAFFYMVTALHGAHLVGGLLAWARTIGKVWRGVGVDQMRLSVELCAVYWHFLLVVWVVLFSLLLFT